MLQRAHKWDPDYEMVSRNRIMLCQSYADQKLFQRAVEAYATNDVIQEAMEIFAQGITLTASLRYVGLPYAMWQNWLKQDHCQSKERYLFALNCHLEAISDKTLHVIEQLES
jgi:hypothetical protein